jgi:serine/threonine protein kinase
MTNDDGRIQPGSTFKARTNPAYSEQRRSGHDLSRLLSSEPAPTGLVIPSFLSIIAAVEEARRGNKGPCNLDPRKIFFRSDGTVELSTLAPAESGMTVVLSSSKYSAPEMVEETTEEADSGLLDSYVLGFVFYEILLGKNLFEQQFEDVLGQGEFGWLTWHADKTKRAKPLTEMISGFPSVLSSLIDGMIAKEALHRITDLHRIADTIGRASQETMMISSFSALQGGDEAYFPQKQSVPQKVDAFWRRLMSTARGGLRKLLWGRIFAGKHKNAPSNAQNAQQFLRQGTAEQARSVRAYSSPNTRRGS